MRQPRQQPLLSVGSTLGRVREIPDMFRYHLRFYVDFEVLTGLVKSSQIILSPSPSHPPTPAHTLSHTGRGCALLPFALHHGVGQKPLFSPAGGTTRSSASHPRRSSYVAAMCFRSFLKIKGDVDRIPRDLSSIANYSREC